ncbi:MAG: response regulator [Caldilineaceae bacterium]|nr:response regulator [Caldilineaceae bacterium]MBP8109448.1 response regulator [Caldilineaceae bacterium]MBP8124703.1 response regulator [Caldilineaceae bacterium]MBP9071681.1 response regulator [Caldilineaceae bacterium]
MSICSYLRTILTKHGATVAIANTGQAGLDAVRQQKCDLILLDLILPDIGGIDVLRRIRAEDETVTVVILTGSGGIKSAISAVQHGADSYVEKQDISSEDGLVEFYHILRQAMERRAGLVAQNELIEAKTDFYSMITHDLRNPAGYIQIAAQMLDLLLQNPVESETEDRDELVEIIQLSATKMLELINNYLDFAKIDAGYLKLSPHRVDLVKIAQDSIHLVKIQAQASRQKLILELPLVPVMAWVDADKFRQVLDNLLSNALKYTSMDGAISLRLWVEEAEAIFEVSDTGQGISAEQLPALFTKYHRIPGKATHGIAGSGLGLLIVKEIVEAHKGTVQVTSAGVAGQGTTFTTRIPLGEG